MREQSSPQLCIFCATASLREKNCRAPDIDGAAVIVGGDKNLQAGLLVLCKVITRRGFDLEVRVY
jgi:hypothetical protein